MAVACSNRRIGEGQSAAKPRLSSDEFTRLQATRLAGRALRRLRSLLAIAARSLTAQGRLGRRRRMADAKSNRRLGEGLRPSRRGLDRLGRSSG